MQPADGQRRVVVAAMFLPYTLEKPEFKFYAPKRASTLQPAVHGNPGLFNAVQAATHDALWVGSLGTSTAHLDSTETTLLCGELLACRCVPVLLTDHQLDR